MSELLKKSHWAEALLQSIPKESQLISEGTTVALRFPRLAPDHKEA